MEGPPPLPLLSAAAQIYNPLLLQGLPFMKLLPPTSGTAVGNADVGSTTTSAAALLAQHYSFLTSPLVMSLTQQQQQLQQQHQQQATHLQLLREHQQLLAKFGVGGNPGLLLPPPQQLSPPQSSPTSSSAGGGGGAGDETSVSDDRSSSSPAPSSPEPIDLSLKITSSLLPTPNEAALPPPRFPPVPRLPELAERFRRECLPSLLLGADNSAAGDCFPSLAQEVKDRMREAEKNGVGVDDTDDGGNRQPNLHAGADFEEQYRADALDLSVNS